MKDIKFIFPIDGDCINSNDGCVIGEVIKLTVKVDSDSSYLLINGIKADKVNGHFETVVDVPFGSLKITAETENDKEEILIYRLKNAEKGFRISADDNILFLKDINDHKNEYKSIFDNKYLKVYKRIHDEFGAKVNLNLFYETENLEGFKDNIEYFNLSMMTDKFKEEFIRNSYWLRFSFHAMKENPGWPYRDTDPEVIKHDLMQMHKEIERFAGEETLSHETTIHYAACNKESTEAAIKMHYKGLCGIFEMSGNETYVSYHYSVSHVLHFRERDFWIDNDTHCLFSKIDRIMNYTNDRNINLTALQEIMKNKGNSMFFEIMTHEQYFYENYSQYECNYEDIIYDSARFLYEKGYKGQFLEDIWPEGFLEVK